MELGVADRIVIVPGALRQDNNDLAALSLLHEMYGDAVARPVPQSVSVKYGLNQGVAVAQIDARGAAASAYRGLAAQVTATGESELTHA